MLFITGHGSKLVPRLPFCVTFRPPNLAIECGAKAVFFGPAGGGLGFSPKGDATVEDVTLDIAEYPGVPIYSLHTEHFAVPITDEQTVFSADEASGHSLEVQLPDATAPDEMLWMQGPLAQPLELASATGELAVVGEGTVEKNNGAARWRECRYELDGTTWHKRFYAITLFSTTKFGAENYFVLLAQCPAERRTAMFELSDRWARGLSG